MNTHPVGYREVEHTADWELEVWAPTMADLLEQAARGMYHLSGIALHPGERIKKELFIEASDKESLLVSFLSELLYIAETENQAFDGFNLKLDNFNVDARLVGGTIDRQSKEIKAVTFHQLEVLTTATGLRVNIVFDV